MDGECRRVAVVEHRPILREGLAQMVRTAPDLALVAAVCSVEEFDGGPGGRADVTLLGTQPRGAVTASDIARLSACGCGVLVVAESEMQIDILQALGAGARGYLGHRAEKAEVLAAIRAVAAGRTHVSAGSGAATGGVPFTLTEREGEILQLVAEGGTDQDIAARLGISLHTVHSHLDRIRDKTGSRRRADLTRLAIEHGLLLQPGR